MSKLFDLENKLKEASQKYYTDGSSDMTDAEFDDALKQLKEMYPESSVITEVGHGYNVEEDSTYGVKRKHIYGLVGSLDKCRTWAEIDEDLRDTTVVTSLKLDGISSIMYYNHGELQYVLTRGNGVEGIDITDKVLRFGHKISTRLSDNRFTGAIRGEILMTYSDFEKYKENNPDVKNPRNTVAGIINRKEATDEDLKYLRIVVYTVVGVDSNAYVIDNIYKYTVMLAFLKSEFGIDNVVPYRIDCLTESYCIGQLEKAKDFFDAHYDYPSDGIVITNENEITVVDGGRINFVSQAFKFASEIGITTVTDIEWNLSKTRYLIPKIKVEPVTLAGTTVQYTSGFNAQYIRDNNIGIGTKVEVEKHGEIIPYINKVCEATEADIPAVCQVCGEPLVWEGVHLVCKNEYCGNAVKQDLLVFLKYMAPIDNFGNKLRIKFFEEYLGKDVSIKDVLANKDNLLHIAENNKNSTGHNALFAEMIYKLFGEVHSLADALCALNIPRLGEVTANKLSKYPGLVMKIAYISTQINCLTPDVASLFDVVGEATTESISNNLEKFKNLYAINDIINFEVPIVNNNGKVAITGKLSVKRSDFEAFCREHGYEPGNISKDTKYLITDDPNSSSSKNKKADEWGIKKITEAEFRNLIEQI